MRHAHLEGPVLPADPCGALALRLDLGGRTVQLDQENGGGVLRVAGARALVDRADHQLVEHLERRRDDAGGDDRRDRLRGVLERRERGEDGLHRLGHVKEPDRGRGDDAKGALRADGHAHQIVARALRRLAAETHELSGARHQLEPEDMVRRDPVLQTVRAAGIGRDVAPDRRDHLARGVGREEISAVCDRSGQREVDQAGLDRGAAVREVDLENSVHPVRADHHAADRRHGTPDQSGAGAPWHDGHALAAAEVDDRDDFIRSRRQRDGVGRTLVEGMHVALVDEPTLG